MPATFSTKIALAPSDSDLFLGRRTHVGGRNLRAQPPRGGDRLQAGNADAHDERLARPTDRAGSGHHHREGAAIGGGGSITAL
jgi:hypothetical protein